jgi:hypothetical protein
MNDLLESAPFEDAKVHLQSICEMIKSASMVYLNAPCDLEGILAISHLEAACIDLEIRYSRRLVKSKQHLPHGEKQEIEVKKEGLTISIEPFEETWKCTDLKINEYVMILPLSVSVRIGSKKSERMGALDVVSQCAAIAANIAPNGARVRRLRPFSISGQWLRGSLDNTFDPIHSLIRDILRDEGSVSVVPLPEVMISAQGMIPNLSETMLKRLRKRWSKMNFESRSQAISELALPSLNDKVISTPRLEELFWHRLVIGGEEQDLYSQIHLTKLDWPTDEELIKSHSSEILRSLISQGKLSI